MLAGNAKLSRELQINFSAIISNKLQSLNYLKVNFCKNNLEKK